MKGTSHSSKDQDRFHLIIPDDIDAGDDDSMLLNETNKLQHDKVKTK